MYIPQISNITDDYFLFNREERNYAAIFYALMFNPSNLRKFINLCNCSFNIDEIHFGIYFEYSYLRDLWDKINKENENKEEIKREIIRNKLKISQIEEIIKLDFKDLNEKFGIAGSPSKDQIQYPGKWALTKFYKNFLYNKEDFLKVCKFKWSFNIKPDIVIQMNEKQVICIEAKYESSEGSYPSSEIEKNIFKKEFDLNEIKQTELQKYMFEDLLGFDCLSVFLRHKIINKTNYYLTLTWKDIFNSLDLSSLPLFAKEMIKKISN